MTYLYTKLSNSLIGMIDRVLMASYHQVSVNTRRGVRLVVTLVPLAMLLVGSCKTSDVSVSKAAFGPDTVAQEFRSALFPTFNTDGMPAKGYISRAQKYVSNAPSALTQLTENEVSLLFGTPSMKRHDADARIWQYRTKTCVMDVYFYGDHDGRPVSYVDYRGAGDQSSDQVNSTCLKRVVHYGTTPDKA